MPTLSNNDSKDAEIQRLKEELAKKDKQMEDLKQRLVMELKATTTEEKEVVVGEEDIVAPARPQPKTQRRGSAPCAFTRPPTEQRNSVQVTTKEEAKEEEELESPKKTTQQRRPRRNSAQHLLVRSPTELWNSIPSPPVNRNEQYHGKEESQQQPQASVSTTSPKGGRKQVAQKPRKGARPHKVVRRPAPAHQLTRTPTELWNSIPTTTKNPKETIVHETKPKKSFFLLNFFGTVRHAASRSKNNTDENTKQEEDLSASEKESGKAKEVTAAERMETSPTTGPTPVEVEC